MCCGASLLSRLGRASAEQNSKPPLGKWWEGRELFLVSAVSQLSPVQNNPYAKVVYVSDMF